ncbi:adenosine deaminase [Alginatibacterium sediminis]|uniref:adenosine deaminase n=1 Tax=Alginatibacterium sediminis TaxID=2164068 RepID=A0A420E8D1_9ALTE|nr:adenosine deaminase [Alginatibacterium sediminis]RKF15736.1 adenosine deaminase [Alginatibacterium sediminis]
MIDTSIPLVDLHRHLDGNIRVNTVWELAQQHAIKLPVANVSDLAPLIQVQGVEADLVSFLSKLDLMVGVLADLDAVYRVAFENVEDIVTSGLDYAELRFSPAYMAMSHRLNPSDVVAAVIDGVASASKQFDVPVKLIGILSRSFGLEACKIELEALLNHKNDIVAIDLAGDELGKPAPMFEELFKPLRNSDLNITIHAGEADGPQSIWNAINLLGAQRIGHGVRAIEDPALMQYLLTHQIGMESCPTSNLHTSTVANYAVHPIKQFLAQGLCVGLNTDDPGVSAIDIQHEYRIAAASDGLALNQEQISTLQRNGLNMAFLSDAERRQLIAKKLT